MSTSLSAGDNISAVLALIKTTWKLGSSLSRLDQETNTVDSTIKNLVWEVKSLGNECDLVYSELEEIATRNSDSSNIDGRIWASLATQLGAIGHTLQELESFVQSIRGDAFTFGGQRQRSLDNSENQLLDFRTRICRHSEYLHLALLLIRM